MTQQTMDHFFGVRHALDHPVTRWILIGVGALLVAAPVIALGLVLPAPIYELAQRAARMIGGTP